MSEPVTNLHGVQLPARFEIRRIGPEHIDWVSALIAHANIYQGWLGKLYEGEQAKIALGWYRAFQETYLQTIKQNMSYGVFDKEYRFKRPESASTGGAVYWSEFDESHPELEVDGRQKLNDAMDFPLVSVGMAFDGSDMEPARLVFGTLAKRFKYAGQVFGAAPEPAAVVTSEPKEDEEPKDEKPKDEKPKNEKPKNERPKWGEVVGRDGTATADAYAGKGLMKALAHFIMSEAKANGYKSMSIGNSSLAVHHVYANPPAPYTATVRMAYHAKDHEVEVDGKKVKPFEKCQDVFRGSVDVHLD